ncbi:MAG: YCF48-related protein [Saprospiraceae bacterium]
MSSDAGQNWSFVAINTDVRWYALPSVNALYVGNLSTLLKSTDGGQTWADITPNVPDVQWRGVSFVSDTRGWTLTSTGDVYRTTDGGASWALVNTGTMTQEGTITFTDANTGYATSFRDLYKTTDGGTTWTLIKANAFGSYQNQLLVLDEQHLVSTQGGLVIYASQDGGANWSSVSPLPYGYNHNYMTALPDGRVWVACDFGSIAFSNDFSSSFTDQLPGFKYYLNSIDFSNNLTGWCAGQSGAIVRTQDGGNTWNEITNLPLNELMESQYLLGVKTYSYEEAVLASDRVINYTDDGGQTWRHDYH